MRPHCSPWGGLEVVLIHIRYLRLCRHRLPSIRATSIGQPLIVESALNILWMDVIDAT